MPSTRRQRRARGSPLGWIDLDPHHTNLPPTVDDHQTAVEQVPPAVAGEQLEHDHLPAQQDLPQTSGPNLIQEAENVTHQLFGDSPLSSAPTTPVHNMPPNRSRGRSRSARPLGGSTRSLADRIEQPAQHAHQISPTMPSRSIIRPPSAQDEQPIPGPSRNTLGRL